ncbi:MAG: hypothetical protein OQJ99_05195 [Rhodospirillales bacterium]|nr:hypothetical protein [Rhodospirillales bacterium]
MTFDASWLTDPLVRAFAVTLFVSAAGTGLVRLIAGAAFGPRLAAIAIGIAALVGVAMTAGVPPFPPAEGIDIIPYLLLAAIIIGGIIDVTGAPAAVVRTALAAVAAVGAWWVMGAPRGFPGFGDMLGMVAVFALWFVILLRLEKMERRDVRAPAMLMAAALGVATIALIGGLLAKGPALAILAALAGFLAWNWPQPRFPFAAAGLMAAGGALPVLAGELASPGGVWTLAVGVLVLVFFVDTALPKQDKKDKTTVLAPEGVMLIAMVLIPVLIAAVLGYLAANM